MTYNMLQVYATIIGYLFWQVLGEVGENGEVFKIRFSYVVQAGSKLSILLP